MGAAQVWTAVLGISGILATVAVAVFTQIFQGRQQDKREVRAAEERRVEKWERERDAAYDGFLAYVSRLRLLYRGARPEDRAERAKVQESAIWEGVPIYEQAYRYASREVSIAIGEWDSAHFESSRAWVAVYKTEPGTPEREEARKVQRAANRAEGAARGKMQRLIHNETLPPSMRTA